VRGDNADDEDSKIKSEETGEKATRIQNLKARRLARRQQGFKN
jgi:hypothetical protein